ncbi:MAG: permease [Akkermansiaceae bacterium]|nr:permease [Akkermansiaceae bacterium]
MTDTPSSKDDDRARRELRRSLLNLTVPKPVRVKPVAERRSCCAPAAPAAGGSCCGGKRGRPDWLLRVSAGLFLFGIGLHYLTPETGWLRAFGDSCDGLLRQTWWGVALGILSVAVLGRVPRELVAALLGRGGSNGGLLRAVGAGVALDLCNHGILMVGMGLYQRGASLGQTLAFLIASPWNSLSLTLILGSLIGWGWTLLFLGLSVVIALVTGWIAERMVAAGKLPANPNSVALPVGYRVRPAIRGVLVSLKPGGGNLTRLWREGLAGSRMILRWILFGFVLTGLIRALVPMDVFQHAFGPTLAGMGLTLLFTTLLEVCSEGSSPVAADLLTRAHAPGNAFVFLMAGAATDYTEVLSLRETTRSWKSALALPLLTTPQVLVIAWLIQMSG